MSGIKRPAYFAVCAAAALLTLAWAGGDLSNARADRNGGPLAAREISPKLRHPGNPAALLVDRAPATSSIAPGVAAAEASVGDQAEWVALNDTGGFFYTKLFELRVSSDIGEVWVAVGDGLKPDGKPDGIFGLDFPPGDCRNDGIRNVVTDAQAAYLLDEFTHKIKAINETWFGAPAFRDGSVGPLPRPSAAGKQVVLVDNVRDDSFYDTNNANTLPYIAGFFTSAMDFFHNRNVMSIDGFDWLHRTGPDPAHEPSADPCTSSPARPFLYEAVFAHEYQHLQHQDYDPDELSWVNEGMADLAMFLTGYSDPGRHIDEKGADSHPMNYQGWASVPHPDWNPIPRPSGPENSLTAWEDQGPTEVLEDYGIAYSFMLYLLDHGYGQSFFTAWHHNPLNGIFGLDETLALNVQGNGDNDDGDDDDDDDDGDKNDDDDDDDIAANFNSDDDRRRRAPVTFDTLFDDFSVSMLVDAYIDAGARIRRENKSELQTDSLNSTFFFSGNAYDTTGAPPWGGDYIPLGPGKNFKQVRFDGDEQLVLPGGNDWTVDADGYWTTPDQPGQTVYPSDLDSSIAREVTVPAGATLTFEHWYQTELGWDFAFVQVLSGGSLVSLPCSGTTSDHNPGADPSIAQHVPGYTGPTDDPANPATAGTAAAPLTATCDLSAYAGQTVVLSFRLKTDGLVEFDGWHIRNVAINGSPVDPTPGDLSDWDNQLFFQPVDLAFKLTFVGIDGEVNQFGHVTEAERIVVVRPELKSGWTYSLSNSHRNALKHSDEVIAIVSGVPEDESADLYFPYSLKVRGVERADGAGLP
jgi:hypothetical protein